MPDTLTTMSAEPTPSKSTEPAPNFLETMDITGPILFDIETGPLPDDELEEFFEFDPTSVKGFDLLDAEFDPTTVKYGQMTDPAKRAAKLNTSRSKFAVEKVEAQKRMKHADDDAFKEFRDKAALSALTCQVLAIGYQDAHTGDRVIDDGHGSEFQLLASFWDLFCYCRTEGMPMIGFYSHLFDVPVLARRAMRQRVPVPPFRKGRYLDSTFVDLMDDWGCGEYRPKGNLDQLSRFFGGPGKNGEGADFYKLWFGGPEEHQQALDYLNNDLAMTAAVARGLQVI